METRELDRRFAISSTLSNNFFFSVLDKKEKRRRRREKILLIFWLCCNSFEQISLLPENKVSTSTSSITARHSMGNTSHQIDCAKANRPPRSIELFFYANTRERNFHKQHSSTYHVKGSLVGITNCVLFSVQQKSQQRSKEENKEKRDKKKDYTRDTAVDCDFFRFCPPFRWYNWGVRARIHREMDGQTEIERDSVN